MVQAWFSKQREGLHSQGKSDTDQSQGRSIVRASRPDLTRKTGEGADASRHAESLHSRSGICQNLAPSPPRFCLPVVGSQAISVQQNRGMGKDMT